MRLPLFAILLCACALAAGADGLGPVPVASAAPSGAASGVLAGSYPSPTFAAYSSGFSVMRIPSATLNPPTLAIASAENHVLRRSGGSLEFGLLDAASISTGTLAGALMPALTGDVTMASNGTATVLANIPAIAGTNLTGTAANLTAGHVTTDANLTGPITSVGNATSVAAQTGTGTTFVMNTSPTLVTPLLGTPTSGTLTNCTGYTADNLVASGTFPAENGSLLTALNGTQITSGTIPVARLPTTPRILWAAGGGYSFTGGTGLQTAYTITVPAATFATGGVVEWDLGIGHTNNGNNKTFTVNYNAVAIKAYVATTFATETLRGTMGIVGATSQAAMSASLGYGQSNGAVVDPAATIANQTTFTITVQNANSGDTSTINAGWIMYYPPVP